MANTERTGESSKPNPFLAGVFWLSAAVRGLVRLLQRESIAPEELTNPEIRFEQSDISARWVIAAFTAILVGTWIVVGLLYFVFAYFSRAAARESPPPLPVAERGAPAPPAPRLQDAPARDYDQVRSAAEAELSRYGWVDRQRGIVSIPIERAVELTAQRGVPPRRPPPNMFFEPQAGSRLTGLEQSGEAQPR